MMALMDPWIYRWKLSYGTEVFATWEDGVGSILVGGETVSFDDFDVWYRSATESADIQHLMIRRLDP